MDSRLRLLILVNLSCCTLAVKRHRWLRLRWRLQYIFLIVDVACGLRIGSRGLGLGRRFWCDAGSEGHGMICFGCWRLTRLWHVSIWHDGFGTKFWPGIKNKNVELDLFTYFWVFSIFFWHLQFLRLSIFFFQIFTWTSLSFNADAIWLLSVNDKYFLAWNSRSNSSNCSLVNAVRLRLVFEFWLADALELDPHTWLPVVDVPNSSPSHPFSSKSDECSSSETKKKKSLISNPIKLLIKTKSCELNY